MTGSLVGQFIEFSLPKPARYGPDDLAGDPVVRRYYEWITELASLDVAIYVSWECPPDVVIVQAPDGNAIVRSERLDTLLVEYHQLQRVQTLLSAELTEPVVRSAVLRWMCELLIGYRQAPLAVAALRRRALPEGLDVRVHNPFRDETLASIPPMERAAIQCFGVGHELGHLIREREEGDLSRLVDGIPVMSHIDFEHRAAGASPAELAALRADATRLVDAPQMLTEIRADLFAFDTVTQFLHLSLGCDLPTAVRCTIAAFEAQLFVYDCKELCRLLMLAATGRLDVPGFADRSLAAGISASARGRALVRRAGVLWATLDTTGGTDDPVGHRYVDLVDAWMMSRQEQRSRVQRYVTECPHDLLPEALAPSADLGAEMVDAIRHEAGLRHELHDILIAFGCPGQVDVEHYLTSMDRSVHRATPPGS